MTTGDEIAPGWPFRVEDSTDHHWLAVCGTVAVLILHEGTEDDPDHVHATARLLMRGLRTRAPKQQLLAVLPPSLAKPPSERVRRALVEASTAARALDRTAAVVLGQGFLPSIHRGAITGVLAVLRAEVDAKVVSTVRDGVAHVVGSDTVAITALTRVCEARLADAAVVARQRGARF